MYDVEPMDDTVRALLKAAGQNPDNMKPDEIKFVYKFLERWDDPKPEPSKPPLTELPNPPGASIIQSYPVVSYEESRRNQSRPLPSVMNFNLIYVIYFIIFSAPNTSCTSSTYTQT